MSRTGKLSRLSTIFIFLIISIFSVGLLVAQDTPPTTGTPTPIPTRSPDDCKATGLVDARNQIDALLDDFDRNALLDPSQALASLYEVGEQYRQLALDCGYLPADINSLVINSTDVTKVMTVLDTLSGDPLRGQSLYNGGELSAGGDHLGCSGCHEGVNGATPIAPPTEGTWTRWDEIRSKDSKFTDYTFEQYVVESVLLPWDYSVPTYPEHTMPDFYHEQIGYQDLADIVEFLNSQDQLITP
ncbi:MAG TPA: hypothetical protein VHL11_17665 [Phototrophicaceae bacterium]|jgi:hypothetical protein|nr:hypothetical protein [Phototrophicaceae bacterium]